MATKKKTDSREKIITAALDLAAQRGWNSVTLSDIAEKANMSLNGLQKIFEDKTDILAAFARMIDQKVMKNTPPAQDEGASTRDNLFDLLMERFDALGPYKGGVISILESFQCDPKQAVIAAPHLCRSMSHMLEAAGDDISGLKGAVKTLGLTILYLNVSRVWMKDETPDLSKTMAALDNNLTRAENLLSRFL